MYPDQRLGQMVAAVLMLLIVALLVLDTPNFWLVRSMLVLATLLYVLFFVNLIRMVIQWQRGELFLLRNLTFYVTVFTLLVVVLLVYGNDRAGMTVQTPTMVAFLATALFTSLLNLYFVRLAPTALVIKLGYGGARVIPWSQVKLTDATDHSLTLRTPTDHLQLQRAQFFAGQWERLLSQLRER